MVSCRVFGSFFCVTVISARSFLAWKQGLKKIKLIRSVCKERTSSFFVFRVRLLEPKVRYYRAPLTKFSKASRDRNLYVTSLKKGQFFFQLLVSQHLQRYSWSKNCFATSSRIFYDNRKTKLLLCRETIAPFEQEFTRFPLV